MKFKTQLLLLALATGATIHFASAQTPPAAPMVGNYRAALKTDPEVKTAAQFALKTQKSGIKLSLISVEQAEKQLVAGMNYRITLKLKSSGKIRFAKAVVYRDLGGKYSLTSWALSTPAKPVAKK